MGKKPKRPEYTVLCEDWIAYVAYLEAELAEAQYRVERMQNEFGLEPDAVYWEQRATTAEMKYQEIQAQVEALQPIFDEMQRQDDKWGADRTHPNEWWYPIMGEELGELGKAMLENHFDYPDADPDDIEKELIEVVAVGIQWLRSIALLKEGE